MVMKPTPIIRAVESVLDHPAGWSLAPEDAYENLPLWEEDSSSAQAADALDSDTPSSGAPAPFTLPDDTAVILLTPQGRRLTQTVVAELHTYKRLALICGRYEGVDERIRTQLATDEISIGDYVLSGGELAAMVIIDAVTRLVPGALGYALGAHQDSHSPGLGGLLEGPQYTRPYTFRGETVPDVLISGHHANINRWRHEQSLLRTLERRPELLETIPLTPADRDFLVTHGWHPQSPV